MQTFSNAVGTFPIVHIGALDGKHVKIQAPALSGSQYFNYLKTNSIVLMAMVDGDYKFTYVDVGAYGRDSDGGVFARLKNISFMMMMEIETKIEKYSICRCSLSDALETNSINIPPPQPLSGQPEPTPFVIVADDAFPLKTYIMKPYSFRQQAIDQRVFNYRLSRARRIVENAFGISAARFRILRRCIDVSVDKAIKLVLAVCVLHNFLVTRNNVLTHEIDHEVNGELVEGSWRAILHEENNFESIADNHGRPSINATHVREQFKKYFVSPEGEVSWQYNTVLRGTTQT